MSSLSQAVTQVGCHHISIAPCHRSPTEFVFWVRQSPTLILSCYGLSKITCCGWPTLCYFLVNFGDFLVLSPSSGLAVSDPATSERWPNELDLSVWLNLTNICNQKWAINFWPRPGLRNGKSDQNDAWFSRRIASARGLILVQNGRHKSHDFERVVAHLNHPTWDTDILSLPFLKVLYNVKHDANMCWIVPVV